MLLSYNWLQKYFKDKLPSSEKVRDALDWHAFEVEKVEAKNDDYIFDIATTPDRNCYALSHQGIVYELSAILDLEKQNPNKENYEESDMTPVSINIDVKDKCTRYIGRRIENIKVESSPKWLVDRLESLGQRSINNIVDCANYIMFDVGQPLHAFDADKIKGSITVRMSKTGEKITTLDGKEIIFNEETLIIADDEGPIAIAGIKGGKKAEVDSKTKNIILEAATFDKKILRMTSKRIGLVTDASKRYESGITAKKAEIGMKELTSGIAEMIPMAKIGKMVDMYPNPEVERKISISPTKINDILGIDLLEREMTSILKRLEIGVVENGKEFILTIPSERLDLNIQEDIVEEVGRLYGYEKIKEKKLPTVTSTPPINKSFYWTERIKDILVDSGFSEVMTQSLSSKGIFEIEKSVASDKNYLRENLSDGIFKSLEKNLYNAPLLGLDQVKIFEIGKVFPKTGEQTSLCVGISNTKSYKGESSNEQIRQIREKLLKELSANVQTLCTIDDSGGILIIKGKAVGKINDMNGIMELNLDALINILPDPPVTGAQWHVSLVPSGKYKSISPYPFVMRDLAIFVPVPETNESLEKKILHLIKKEAGDLLVRTDLFDVFTKKNKEGISKTSFAYHLIFQSSEKTLTDEEINKIMAKISSSIAIKGWEVR